MSLGTILRQLLTVFVLSAIFVFAWRTKLDPNRVSLLLTAAICAATVLYASLTFEILLRNQSMAKAASDSTTIMERGLRFSHASNLHFRTLITKDPTFQNTPDCTPIKNEDYQNAIRLTQGNTGQMEFVFCVVKNVGNGPATNLGISTEYRVSDTSNAMVHINVPKSAEVQLLETDHSIALLVYLFKVPTADDKAEIVRAVMTSSDAYRDAVQEQPITSTITPRNHHVESDAGSIARLS